MNYATATPAEIDTEWFALDAKHQQARSTASAFNRRIQEVKESGDAYLQHFVEQWTTHRDEADAEADKLHAQMQPHRTEWAQRGGWKRYNIVVTNGSGGHVHRTMGCSTTFPTTMWQRLPQVSGLNDEEVVDLAGERACTVCWPDAPVSKLSQSTRLFTEDEVAKQARREEREAKRAEKAKKAITDVDGKPLRGRWGVVNTEVSARREGMDALFSKLWYGDSDGEYRATAEKMATAVAHKTGESKDDLLAEWQVKAEKKYKREMR